MTKEEKIKEAYGELYETNKSKIDEDGWCSGRVNLPNTHIEWHPSRWMYWRPKSLEGLESNNGWIKIESEADLPKEYSEYWCFDRNNDIEIRYFNPYSSLDKREYLKFITHCQPIVKPKPPIY